MYLNTKINVYNKNYINYLKGFLIFLVVLGHEIQSSFYNYDDFFIFKLIYSFHMPFFILLSGYLASMSIDRSGCNFEKCVKKKLIYLLIPFLSWYLILLIFEKGIFNLQLADFTKLFLHIDMGLWYLYVLFFLYIITFISLKFNNKYFVLVVIFIFIPQTNIFGMNLLKWYLLFFIIGMLIFDYKKKVNDVIKLIYYSKIKYFIFILFFISLVYWEREFSKNSIFPNIYFLYSYKFFTSILGIASVYILTSYLYKKKFLLNTFNLFGENSMKIYILNILLISFIFNIFSTSQHFILIGIAFFINYSIVYTVNLFRNIYFVQLLFGVKERNIKNVI